MAFVKEDCQFNSPPKFPAIIESVDSITTKWGWPRHAHIICNAKPKASPDSISSYLITLNFCQIYFLLTHLQAIK